MCWAPGSHDRSIRRWERTEEPFFIEEEQERRLESMFEEGIDNAGPQDEVSTLEGSEGRGVQKEAGKEFCLTSSTI